MFPRATYCRLQHCIGTAHLARVLLDQLKSNLPDRVRLEEKHELCVIIAALVHDLGHGPLSHTFEREVGSLEG